MDELKHFPKYADSFVIKYSTIIMSISQVSETLFMLAMPFFLKKSGIKKVMLISMLAWVLRFGLLGFSNPQDGLWMIILSCVVYGMAVDFFNISGSLFVETNTDSKMRSSAQGLFMMMTNGFGAVFGSLTSGWMIDKYFTKSFNNTQELSQFLDTTPDNDLMMKFIESNGIKITNGVFDKALMFKDWEHIWLSFAAYALIIAIFFAILFKHKHNPNEVENVKH